MELLRFVRALDGEICFDEKKSLPARGVWLCADGGCLSTAFKKKLLFRGEKNLNFDPKDMTSLVKKQLKNAALSRLGLLRRQGKLESGMDAVIKRMRESESCYVILAKDFSPKSVKKISFSSAKLPQAQLLDSSLSMQDFALSLGRRETGVVALSKSRITDEIVLRIKQLATLG